MLRKIFLLIIINLVFIQTFKAQEETRLLRFPNTNGSQIVFSYAGDLYSVSINGGIAQKLTNDVGYEMFAKYSPDGKEIAFTAQYDGNTEVFSIPSEGGIPKRLTITATLNRDAIGDRMGPNNIVMCWTPDGKNIVYRSRRYTFNDFTGQLFMVPSTGGMSQEIPLKNGGFCTFSPDGKKLALNRVFREFRTWKKYQGGMADDVWVFDFATKQVTNITNNPAQDLFPMWHKDEIYFISDRDKIMNLFVYNTITKEIKKVTDFKEFDIKFPSIGKDKIVFENGGFIYVFDITTQKSEKVKISIVNDFIYARSEFKTVSRNISGFSLSPDGSRILFNARGDIFNVPAKSGITKNYTKSSNANDRAGVWSPDGKSIAYLSDKNGEYEIYLQKEDGSEQTIQLTKDADTYKFSIRWSPDSKKIIWSDKMLRLQFVDINSKAVTLVDKSEMGEFTEFDWSPDSKWIVYTRQEKESMNKIWIYSIEQQKKYEVTDGWYNSGGGTFSRDGKYLIFYSSRDFNPTVNDVEWNFSYKNMGKIYLTILSKTTLSPFSPQSELINIPVQTIDTIKKDTKIIPAPTSIKIDVDGLVNRTISLPIKASNYFNFYGLENGKIYYNEFSADANENCFKFYDLINRKEVELGSGINFQISANSKKILIRKSGNYYVTDVPEYKLDLRETVDVSKMTTWINYSEEWKQIFDESWRQMRDFFFVPNMQGYDWKAIHDRYAALVPYVKHRDDLTYIISEMIGELNLGHTYFNTGEAPTPKRITLGLPGAKFSKDASGYFRVDKILKGLPWSSTLRSPMTDVGVNINEGDYIIAVNGISTKNMSDIFHFFIGTSGSQVELTYNTKPDEKGCKKTIIIPVSDEGNLYYYNWVQNNIEKVNKATNGQVGYIHIPDMSLEGLNEFVKYFYPQLSKKALIIDDRGNGGGNVSPMIIERLKREMAYVNMSRNVNAGTPTPRQTHVGPKVMLIDNYSVSDGDLFPYQFKFYKLGKVIGVRSWGGVTGIRGSLPFIDGSDLRKPEYGKYSADGKEWIIEGRGIEPDIVIDNDPAKEYLGEDMQLNKAIEIILEEIKNFKGYIPPVPEYPNKNK